MFGTLDNPTQNFQTARLEEICAKITEWKTWWMCHQKKEQRGYFVGSEKYMKTDTYDTAQR